MGKRWFRFVEGLNFEQRFEFNEGDVGLAGGIQVLEAANANPTTIDMIKRFGGSTSPSMQWPEEDGQGDDDSDKFERLEKLIQKAMARITTKGGGGKRGGRGGSSAGEGSGSGGVDGGGSGGAGEGGDEDDGHGDGEHDEGDEE